MLSLISDCISDSKGRLQSCGARKTGEEKEDCREQSRSSENITAQEVAANERMEENRARAFSRRAAKKEAEDKTKEERASIATLPEEVEEPEAKAEQHKGATRKRR